MNEVEVTGSSPNFAKPVLDAVLVQEGNKLIEIFKGERVLCPDGKTFGIKRGMPKEYENWYYIIKIEYLEYHSSLDWLMPVVEKIESMGYIVEIWLSLGRGCKIFKPNYEPNINFCAESNSLIEAIWLTVVDFIKWHNQNDAIV